MTYKIPAQSMLHVMTFMAMMVLMALYFALPVQAQDETERQKPELVEIIVNASNTDSAAMEVAKKLDPIFFDIAEEDKDKVSFYARYLSLDENNENNYIIFTAEDSSGFYCTGHGCPFFLYRSDNRNQWSLVLSLQAFNLYHDVATRGDIADNIISIGNMQGQRHLSVWAWNGQNYSEITR